MSHIPTDDVRQLFGENKQKSWSGLHQVLEHHKGQADNIEDSIVSNLLIITNQMESAHQPYPMTSDQLQQMLDAQLTKATS